MRRVILAIMAFALAGTDLQAQDKVDFATQIQPILKQRCYRCHGPKDDKGGLRLHTFIDIDDSAVIFAGEPDESEMLRRLTLPEDDEERMPKGSAPLAPEHIELIRLWITQGAEMPEGDHTQLSGAVEEEVAPAPPEAVEKLAETGALVMPIAQDTNRLRVSFIGRAAEVGDAEIALVAPLAEQLTWLNLARTGVTDAGLAPISTCTNLTQLHLEVTGIGDQALAHLSGLEKLEYLNLYGTKVSDAGLEHLKGLKNLKRLYLWQTDVTYAAAMKMQDEIEGLEVNLGYDHPEVIRATLKRRIELAQQRKEEAAALEEQARQEKEAAAEQEAEAQKELEEFEKEQSGDAGEPEGADEPEGEAAAEEEETEKAAEEEAEEETEKEVEEKEAEQEDDQDTQPQEADDKAAEEEEKEE